MGFVSELRDGLTNLISGAGTAADKRAHNVYALRHVDPAQVEAAYRSSWLVRKIVDLPAHDATREWRRWQAAPEIIAAIEAEERRLELRRKVRRALVLARLHGGAAILLGVGDGDTAAPIDTTRIGKGSLRYAHVLSRWELAHGERRMDPEDPWFGQPTHFLLRGRGGGEVKLHPSRVVAFVGQAVPEASSIGGASWFWGDPLLQSIEDAVKNADAAQNGFAALIDEAKVDVFGIPDQLFASVSSGKEVSGGAYSAGGQAIAGSAVALDGATPEWTHDDVVWSQHASGFTTARYAVWHDSGSGRLIGYLDLTSNRGNVNGPLTLDVTAATGIASF